MGSVFDVRGSMFSVLLFALLLAGAAPSQGAVSSNQTTVIVAVGAAGEGQFGKEFADWAGLWQRAADRAGAKGIVLGLGPTNADTDLTLLKGALASEPKDSPAELWLVLLGHGTFDGREAKFNLRGPDLAAGELAGWLKPFRRPLVVANCASSSSPFINALSAPGRVIVTATRSGHEQNYARLGGHLAKAITDPAADLDKDGQTSLLEGFIMASRRAAEFYETEGRLATEHALLDDNGDGLGTPADWFRGVRAVKKPEGGAAVDGLRAHQVHLVRSRQEQGMPPELRARRDALESAMARLRDEKKAIGEAEYYCRLERLLMELASLYAGSEKP
jgi:hypothetical protein